MAKKVSKKRKVQPKQRGINWYLIGGIVGIGVLGLFALLFLSLRGASSVASLSLEDFCEGNPDNCVEKGSEEALVTIIEISDFGCPHCRNYNTQTAPLIDRRYVESGLVRYIALPYALGATTAPAANAGLCAAEQNRYFEFSAAMFARFDEADALERSGFLAAGEAAGLDEETFTSCMNQSRYDDILRANISAASDAGVSTTPNFFVNGRKVKGAQPFAAFQQQIDSLLGS